jgi:uncharacterized membrane protein YfcA
LIAAGAVLSAAAAAGFSGFGFNLVAVPLLAFVLPVKDAVTIGLMLGVLATSVSAALALRRSQVHLRLLALLLLGSIPGLIVGTVAYLVLNEQGLRITIGVATACFPLLYLMPRLSKPRAIRARESVSVGFVGGSFAATTGTGGPPIVMYLLTTLRDATVLRGTILGHVAAVTVLALAAHGIQGQISTGQLSESARLAPAALVGLVAGSLLFRRVSARAYQNSLRVILAVLSVSGLALAIR